MKFLADESVDADIVRRLRAKGHGVDYIAEMLPGLSDEVVLEKAMTSRSMLITADKDFGELVFHKKKRSLGMLLLRLAGLTASEKERMATEAIEGQGPRLQHCFTVVTPTSIRSRHM